MIALPKVKLAISTPNMVNWIVAFGATVAGKAIGRLVTKQDILVDFLKLYNALMDLVDELLECLEVFGK